MRLILDSELRPETVERLRALSPALEVVDVSGDLVRRSTLADPEVEVIVGAASAGRPGRRAVAALAAGPLGRRRPPRRRSALAARASWSPTPGASTRSRSPSTSRGMVLRVHQPAAAWSADQAAHAGPARTSRRSPRRPRQDARSSPATARSAARWPASCPRLGLRIVAVKPRPEVRADTGVPGARARATRTARSPSGSSATRSSPTRRREADVLVLTMPLTEASRGVISATVIAALPAARVAHQRLARPARRRAGPARGAARRPAGGRRPRRLRRGAAAARQPVVGRPERHRHAARLGQHVPVLRRARRRERPALPGRRAAAQPGRSRARILGAEEATHGRRPQPNR